MKIMILIFSFVLMSVNPVTLMIFFLLISISVMYQMYQLIFSMWYSFLVMLMLLGGLMVLFIYIISLMSDQMFDLQFSWMSLILPWVLLMIVSSFNVTYINQKLCSPILLFEYPFLMTIMIMFLLLILLIVVKAVYREMGPMRG